MTKLFSPLTLGNIKLSHRVIMAPMTRCRTPGGTPNEKNIKYYEQRATKGGLLISEGASIAKEFYAYPDIPGIFNEDQVAGWKKVTQAVHAKGGYIVCQLWHPGRATHSSLNENQPPVSSSAVPMPKSKVNTVKGDLVPAELPRPLSIADINYVLGKYENAAKCAIDAEFDGVEIHAANGYLIDQFLKSGVNQRTDEYGQSIENRARLLFQVLKHVTTAIPRSKVGLRLSPFNPYNDCTDPEEHALFEYVLKRLSQEYPDIAYVHVHDARPYTKVPASAKHHEAFGSVAPTFRHLYAGNLIVNGSFDKTTANQALEENLGDAVAFGKPFLANPDLVRRLQENKGLNQPDMATLYYSNPPEKGYTDYPALEE